MNNVCEQSINVYCPGMCGNKRARASHRWRLIRNIRIALEMACQKWRFRRSNLNGFGLMGDTNLPLPSQLQPQSVPSSPKVICIAVGTHVLRSDGGNTVYSNQRAEKSLRFWCTHTRALGKQRRRRNCVWLKAHYGVVGRFKLLSLNGLTQVTQNWAIPVMHKDLIMYNNCGGCSYVVEVKMIW